MLTLRSAHPDEHSRIKSIMQGAAVPPHAKFLVFVKEHPVERIIAALPWWIMSADPAAENTPAYAEISLHIAGAAELSDEQFTEALGKIEKEASLQSTDVLVELPFQGTMVEANPIFKKLTNNDFKITQTDRHYLMPGDTVKERSIRFYQKLKHKIPQNWKIESIRGQNPEEIWSIIAQHSLMPPHSFKNHWDGASREHFEEDYSSVIIEDGKIIATLLITKRGSTELHIHVDAVSKAHSSQSNLATMMMRNFFSERCPADSPEHFSWRADDTKHKQTQNTAHRYGGEELGTQYLLSKKLN